MRIRSSRTWIVFPALVLLVASLAAAQVVPGRYIVELTEEPVAVSARKILGQGRKAAMEERRNQVLNQQFAVRRLLRRHAARAYESVDTVANALLVNVSDDQAKRLATLPGVKRVARIYEYHASLEHAIPLHKVPEGWQRLGSGELAGAGISIGIIDTGINNNHPGFIDLSIPMREGFPRVNQESDLQFTSNKVIVARSYLRLLGESDSSARDSRGHGSGVAMAAAGVPQTAAHGTVSGVAPKAWLGSYNIFSRANGTTQGDLILKALDDAVADGMDVINLSLGSPFALRPEDDIFSAVFDRITRMGVVVVVAAGNDGPEPFTMGDLGVSPSAVAVGAMWNDRVLSASVRLQDGQGFRATPSDGPNPSQPIAAPMKDVAEFDPTGLACDTMPASSLAGQIALILRGVCFFEDKLNNAEAAGAVGAVVYTDADRPESIIMSVGGATLPAVMVDYDDGVTIKDTLAGQPGLTGTVDFERNPFPVDPNRVAMFSSRGPNTDLGVKPDLVAVGVSLNTAGSGLGFSPTQGTSFSAPLVAGAAAVLKADRPGYPGHHYRSLLINASDPLVLESGSPAKVQHAGAGILNLDASLRTTVTAYPTSLSFGATQGAFERELTIFNLGTAEETFSISYQAFDGGPPPTSSVPSLTIPPRESRSVALSGTSAGLPPNGYQGMVWIQGSRTGTQIHVPYWYGVTSDTAAAIKVVDQVEAGVSGGLIRRGISVRTTDKAGVPIDSPPTVTAVSGGGSVLGIFADEDIPGLFDVNIRLGPLPGENIFRVDHGEISKEVSIEGL